MLLSIADNCITHHLVGKHETSQDNLAPGRKAAPSAGKKNIHQFLAQLGALHAAATPCMDTQNAECMPCSGSHLGNGCREKGCREKHTHKLKTKGGPRSTFMKLKQNSLSVFCNPLFPSLVLHHTQFPNGKNM